MAEVLAAVWQWVVDIIKNVGGASDGMTLLKWIRMIAIVGGYLLLRPYIEKGAAKWMGSEHEKELDPAEMAKANGKKAKISPNSLRGQVEIPDDTDEEEEEGQATGADWGKKARKRQRTVLRKILEAEEKLLQEDDDDDIKEFLESDALVDYKEGEDGW